MDDRIIAIIVISCGFAIIVISVTLVFQKLRSRARKNAEAMRVAKALRSEHEPEPPIHTITTSSSGNYSGFFRLDEDLDEDLDPETRGVDRPHLDLWEFRQEQRRQFILEHIDHKTVTAKMFKLELPHASILAQRTSNRKPETSNRDEFFEGTQSKEDTISTGDTSNSVGMPKLRLKRMAEYSHTSCPICNEKYKEGDEVCWSREELCDHAFHLNCQVRILMTTDACIICKKNFLQGGCCHSTLGIDEEESIRIVK